MRPCASQAAKPDPIATDDREDGEKERDHAGGAADRYASAKVGSIDKTTAPTSQNQLATSAPHHSR